MATSAVRRCSAMPLFLALLAVAPVSPAAARTVQVGSETALVAALEDSTVAVVEVTGPIAYTAPYSGYDNIWFPRINRVVTVRAAGCSASDTSCTQTLDAGGAVCHFWAGGNVTFENIRFWRGLGEAGGAVYVESGSEASFSACLFEENQADLSAGGDGSSGGAVYLAPGSEASFEVCEFSRQKSLRGGAVYLDSGSEAFFSACVFKDNQASQLGDNVFVNSTGAATFLGSDNTMATCASVHLYDFSSRVYGFGCGWPPAPFPPLPALPPPSPPLPAPSPPTFPTFPKAGEQPPSLLPSPNSSDSGFVTIWAVGIAAGGAAVLVAGFATALMCARCYRQRAAAQVHAKETAAAAAAAPTCRAPPSILPISISRAAAPPAAASSPSGARAPAAAQGRHDHVSITVEDPPAASPARPQQNNDQHARSLSRWELVGRTVRVHGLTRRAALNGKDPATGRFEVRLHDDDAMIRIDGSSLQLEEDPRAGGDASQAAAHEADELVNSELRASELAERRAAFRERQEAARAAKEADDLVSAELEATEMAQRQAAAETKERQVAAQEELRQADALTFATLRASAEEGIRAAAKAGRRPKRHAATEAAARVQGRQGAQAGADAKVEENVQAARRTEKEEEMADLLEAVLARRESREPFLNKYHMEPSTSECKGASGVVVFGASSLDQPVALKFFARRADYDSELDGCKRAVGPHTVTVVDMVGPNQGLNTRGRIARYGCIVFERGDVTLAEFWRLKRHSLSAIQKQAILHQVLVAVRDMHRKGLVHGDVKPQNLVKVHADDAWKLIDFVTCSAAGSSVPLVFSFRYAAPEVLRADAAGLQTMQSAHASDMWSVGVIMFELYTGQRFLDPEEIPPQAAHDEVCAAAPMELKGLNLLDPSAARVITKLLNKDPAERWTAEKCLSSNFFQLKEDTTKAKADSEAVVQQLTAVQAKLNTLVMLVESTLTNMEVGDLLIEYILQEIAPKHQSCILSDHERVGAAFHLVAGCIYRVKVNIFREGPGLDNPVACARELTLTAADGTPLRLQLSATTAPADAAPLPQCVRYEGLWDPSACQSKSLLEPTKWPHTRSVQAALTLELHGPTARVQTVSTELFFQVHAKETMGLRAKRAKEWARDEYLKLTPGTRAAISGAIAVAKVAAKASMMGL